MHPFEKHRQWPAVHQVCATLKAAGFQAWLAGGCVRDLVMNRVPNDFDVATNARPEAVEGLFPQAITVGREFGVTILPFDDFQVEVATFRQDGPYADGRHPSHITFSTPEEDAKRRDFTVNALFFDTEKRTVVDFVGGQADIQARLLRAVGDPDRRFDEDKLRILRAVRFAAQLDFTIEQKTFEAVLRLAPQIKIVATERIRDEVLKLMKSARADLGLTLLRDTGLWAILFPELVAVAEEESTFEKLRTRVRKSKSIEPTFATSAAALLLLLDFVDMDPKPHLSRAQTWLKRLRFSNQETEAVMWSLRMRETFRSPSQVRHAHVIRALGHTHATLAEAIYAGDSAQEKDALARFQKIHTDVLGGRRELPARWVSGDDLLQLGTPRGPELGRLLEELYDRQLEGMFQNREQALTWAQTQI